MGKLYKVVSFQLTVTTNNSGNIGVDLGLTTANQGYNPLLPDSSQDLPVTLLRANGPSRVVGNGNVLMATTIHAQL